MKLCGALKPTEVLHHYAYGDHLPIYARFVGEDNNEAQRGEGIKVYISCEREAGHTGKHLARGTFGWEGNDEI